MALKYIIGGGLLIGAMVTGVYCSDEIRGMINKGKETVRQLYETQKEEPEPPKEKTAADLLEDMTILKGNIAKFSYDNKDDVLAGQYDAELELAGTFIKDLFIDIEPKEDVDKLSQKANATLYSLRQDICQEPIAHLAAEMLQGKEEVLNNYLSPAKQAELKEKQTIDYMSSLPPEKQAGFMHRMYGESQENYDIFLRKKTLDFWLEGLNRNFSVKFSREKEPESKGQELQKQIEPAERGKVEQDPDQEIGHDDEPAGAE